MNLKDRAKALKIQIPTIYLVLKDKETPVLPKILAFITVAYALSPIDLIPDFIPVLGYLDDIILLPLFIALTIKYIPNDVYLRNQAKANDLWSNGKPKKWYYAIPIVIFWFIVLFYVANLALNYIN